MLSTLLFVSDIITDITSEPQIIIQDGETDPKLKHAAVRLILAVVMSLSWSALVFF